MTSWPHKQTHSTISEDSCEKQSGLVSKTTCRDGGEFDCLLRWGWQSRTGHAVKCCRPKKKRMRGSRAGAWPSGSWGAGARGRSTLAAKFVLRGTGGEGGTRGPRPRLQGEWPIMWTLQQAKDAQRQWIDRHQIWSRPRAANRGDRGAPIGPRCLQRPRFGSRAEDDAGGRISGHANLKSGPQGTRRKPIHWVRLTNYGDTR